MAPLIIGGRTAQHHRSTTDMESTKVRPPRQFTYLPDPANPGGKIRKDFYQQQTGLPLPEDQTPIDQLQLQIVAALASELDPYYHGQVAIEVISQWLQDHEHDEQLSGTGRYLSNAIGMCRPDRIS